MRVCCLGTKGFVGGVQVACQDERVPTCCLHTNTDSPFQRANRWESYETSEPSITLNTGGAQDWYPAPRLAVLSSTITSDIYLQHRASLNTGFMPSRKCNVFQLRPPASTVVVTLTSCGCSHPNCVSAPIDTLNTQAFVENQIKDFCEHAHSCYFGCHGRTSFQRYRNFDDCHPSVPVDPFDPLRHTRFFHCLWHWHPRRISPPSMIQNYCICQRQFSSVLRPANWPSVRLPDCVSRRCVSRSHQSSSEGQRSSRSTTGTMFFGSGSFVLCTSVPENVDH